ncbi:hypothetical protein R3P38DRAFT_2768400 [Favolaschia claudopus]|uniref:Uncharacterized protein n=1 Tax=Favolaschia claudopus TaxID=2862362 RepID=A0AAW0CMA5_9AGAR
MWTKGGFSGLYAGKTVKRKEKQPSAPAASFADADTFDVLGARAAGRDAGMTGGKLGEGDGGGEGDGLGDGDGAGTDDVGVAGMMEPGWEGALRCPGSPGGGYENISPTGAEPAGSDGRRVNAEKSSERRKGLLTGIEGAAEAGEDVGAEVGDSFVVAGKFQPPTLTVGPATTASAAGDGDGDGSRRRRLQKISQETEKERHRKFRNFQTGRMWYLNKI